MLPGVPEVGVGRIIGDMFMPAFGQNSDDQGGRMPLVHLHADSPIEVEPVHDGVRDLLPFKESQERGITDVEKQRPRNRKRHGVLPHLVAFQKIAAGVAT